MRKGDILKTTFLWVMGIALTAALPCGCGESATSSTGTDGLYGDWRLVSAGDKNLLDLGAEVIWTISESTITVHLSTGEQISQNKYSTNDSQDPKHFDMYIRDLTDVDRYGIYDLDADTLRISLALEGNTRPHNWSEGKTMVFERVGTTPARPQ